MSLSISIRTELIKAKRSSAFWLCLIGSGFIPAIFLIMYLVRPNKIIPTLTEHPWESHFEKGWQSFAAFLLPMFVILVCSMIPQIEFKNNTWKQVFASPQSLGNIFFSKFTTILLMVLFLFFMFNFFMFGNAVLANLIFKKYPFLSQAPDWISLLKINLKTFVSLLGIISIQYWLSLRFKNFIVPIAIGLALLITSLILLQWEHADKIPFAFPLLTFISMSDGGQKSSLFQNHELNSIGYFIFFTALAFFDMKYRKERG